MGFVYVFQNGSEHKFKIGLTRGDTTARRKQLSTGNPNPLNEFDVIETEHCEACEQFLHKTLQSKKIAGGHAQEFFAMSPEELRQVIQQARDYIAEYTALQPLAESLRQVASNGELKKPGNEDVSVYREIIELREQEDRARLRRELLEWRLKISIGNSEGLEGIATWKSGDRESFDQAAFRAAYPELYNAFRRSSQMRRFCLE